MTFILHLFAATYMTFIFWQPLCTTSLCSSIKFKSGLSAEDFKGGWEKGNSLPCVVEESLKEDLSTETCRGIPKDSRLASSCHEKLSKLFLVHDENQKHPSG
jgi:hypothetical protein